MTNIVQQMASCGKSEQSLDVPFPAFHSVSSADPVEMKSVTSYDRTATNEEGKW